MATHRQEAQPFPKRQQLDVHGAFAKANRRVVAESAVLLSEIAKAEAVQVALMGGVAKGAEIGVVRRDNRYYPAAAN